MTCRDQIV